MRTADPSREQIETRFDALLDQVMRLSDAELRMLRMAWQTGDQDERAAVWRKARTRAKQMRRDDLLDDAHSTLARWVNSYLSATALEYGNFLMNPGSGMNAGDVRRDAIPPVMDAVAATVAGDGLDAHERDLLLDPINQLARHDADDV